MIKINFIINNLKQNKIVAIPTDTIYGLSCLPSVKNIKKLQKLKQRNPNKGFILLTSELRFLSKYIDAKYITQLEQKYQTITTPTTFIAPSKHKFATNNTIAVRLARDENTQQICAKLKSAIISTSCNIATRQNIKTILKLRLFFGEIPALTPKNNTKTSTIINLTTGEILR